MLCSGSRCLSVIALDHETSLISHKGAKHAKKGMFLFSPVFVFFVAANAQAAFGAGSTGDGCSMVPDPATAALFSNIMPDESSSREDRCLRTARWIGAMSGSTMGFAHIYWRATGVSGIHGPFWKSLVTGIPSAVAGAYVGARSTEWMTRRIMEGSPKPGRAALKGAAYGAIDGAIVLTASVMPLLIIGHYMDTIDFSVIKIEQAPIYLK